MCKNGRIWRWVDHTVGHSTLIVSVGDCVESDSDTDDDFEECFCIAPYRFEPTNNSPEREISVKVDSRE